MNTINLLILIRHCSHSHHRVLLMKIGLLKVNIYLTIAHPEQRVQNLIGRSFATLSRSVHVALPHRGCLSATEMKIQKRLAHCPHIILHQTRSAQITRRATARELLLRPLLLVVVYVVTRLDAEEAHQCLNHFHSSQIGVNIL